MRATAATEIMVQLLPRFRQQVAGVGQVRGVPALGEPVVDLGQKAGGHLRPALTPVEAVQADGRPQSEGARFSGRVECGPEAVLVGLDLAAEPIEFRYVVPIPS